MAAPFGKAQKREKDTEGGKREETKDKESLNSEEREGKRQKT